MVKPYSMDLRERVAQAGVSEGSARGAARQFSVGASTAIRWVKRWRETGDVSPGQIGGHRDKLLNGHKEWLMERFASEPDVTLRRLLAELEERGVTVSYGALWNFVHDEGLSVKKNKSRQRTAKA
jgi:putative transposase